MTNSISAIPFGKNSTFLIVLIPLYSIQL
jgi:hypothetical protein